MSDTPDWADQSAAELLPHFGAYHGIIAGCVCSCNHRPAVAEALRAAKQAGLEEAATFLESYQLPDMISDQYIDILAGEIRALKEQR